MAESGLPRPQYVQIIVSARFRARANYRKFKGFSNAAESFAKAVHAALPER
jgi:hypothetical protein